MNKKYRLNEKAWSNKDAWRLVNDTWTLCHEFVDLRDGHRCVLCLRERDLQLDHAISRTHKSVFFDTDNLNWLCDKCHTAKSFNPCGIVGKRVDEVTRRRMGSNSYEKMLKKAEINCTAWRTVWWQEACNIELKEQIAFAKSVQDIREWK